MKKLLLLIITISVSTLAYSQDIENRLSFGANLGYGTKAESISIGLRAQYGIDYRLRTVAEYKYYFRNNGLSAWEVDTDIHYIFYTAPAVKFYPLAGLKYSHWTNRHNGKGQKSSKTHDRLGINIGGGMQVALSENIGMQIELKQELTPRFSQLVISVGLAYHF